MTQQEKQTNLYNKVKGLIEALDDKGIKCRSRRINPDNWEYVYIERDWSISTDGPENTFGGVICHDSNKSAFRYLKLIGAIDIGVCWHCGEEPIKKEYEFSSGDTVRYYICEACYKRGIQSQKQILGL